MNTHVTMSSPGKMRDLSWYSLFYVCSKYTCKKPIFGRVVASYAALKNGTSPGNICEPNEMI